VFNYGPGTLTAQPSVACPTGKKALGGGTNAYDLKGSWPISGGQEWNVSVQGPNNGNNWSVTVYATCATTA
jgi:hypothetical protein